MSQQNQAVILISFPGSTAYQVYQDQRVPLSAGVLDLSLVSLNSTINYDNPTEIFDSQMSGGTDYWLVLSIRGDEKAHAFELALPSGIPIDRIGDCGYSIPSPTLPDAYIDIELPEKHSDEDKESLEVILGSYASLPVPQAQSDLRGKLCLVDTQDGQILGSLDEAQSGAPVEDPSLSETGNEKHPVVVDFPDQPDESIRVSAAKDPSLMIRSSNYVSQTIIGGGNLLGKGLAAGSQTFVAKTKTGEKPLVFSENSRKNAARVHKLTGQVASVSAKTSGVIADSARGVGAYVSGKGKKDDKEDKKPGFFNKAFTAVDNVFTSVEEASRTFVSDASMAGSVMAAHKYGPDAGKAVRGVGDSVHNAAIVYIDVKGVSRKALIKSAGKGAVFGGKQSAAPANTADPSPSPSLPSKN
ncbi:hypothetical protein E3P86_03387 [Wallemia ichthyophaga]|uniref:Senescence domain-containing protein n=1 Tax=Wallemia ichthyophaga TaxID=245174 RepID=A0A4T0IRQ9_WALIC|nr:hypothetical protein E3P86_03387 [Wallemia ichthyophaga]